MRAFLADVKENPEDDTPRLILADWLDEYGGPADQARADLIRTQIEKARLPQGHPDHFVLGQRERELIQRWGSAWVGPLLDRVRLVRHERGMVMLTLSCGMLQARGLLQHIEQHVHGSVPAQAASHEQQRPALKDTP